MSRRPAVLLALASAAWLGAALLTVAVVAPGAFAVLPTRTLAGAMVGRVLPVVFGGALVLGAVALTRWRADRVVGGSGLVALAASLWVTVLVNPRIAAIRAEVAGGIDALPPGDPVRAEFGRLHGLSVLGLGVAMAALAVTAVAATRRALAEPGRAA